MCVLFWGAARNSLFFFLLGHPSEERKEKEEGRGEEEEDDVLVLSVDAGCCFPDDINGSKSESPTRSSFYQKREEERGCVQYTRLLRERKSDWSV